MKNFPFRRLVPAFGALLSAAAFLCLPLYAQDSPSGLPRAFRGLALGMSRGELTAALQRDGSFDYRGERDVSFLPRPDESLIDVSGRDYIKRAFFQLTDGAVFSMTFNLNQEMIDYYSIFTSIRKKYGEPVFLNPHGAVWTDESTRISLERPLVVKYIDLGGFNELIQQQAAEKSLGQSLREDFLGSF